MLRSYNCRKAQLCAGLLFAITFSGLNTQAALDDADTEFSFLTELIEYGFPDFAEKRLREIETRFPGDKDRLQMSEAQILIANRKYDEAEKIAASMPEGNPKADAIKLSLANALSRIGQGTRADVIYNKFFERYKDAPPTDKDLLRFYQESAYRLVKIRENANDFKGAAAAYELLLKTKPPEDVQRQVQVELSELYLKAAENSSGAAREANLKKAEKTAADIRWGKYDTWFGRSIGITAMAQVMRGNREEAQKLIKDYMKDLKAIDKALKEAGVDRSLSPMASVRYLAGKLYEEDFREALKNGETDKAKLKKLLSLAITEYANVFGKYPNSDWGPDAGLRDKRLRDEAKKLGSKVNQEGGDPNKRAVVSAKLFLPAQNLFNQKEYEGAISSYLGVINEYPDADESIKGLANVMKSYEKTDQHFMVKVVASYLAERFPDNKYAASAVRSMGGVYYKQKKTEEYFYYFDLFVDSFKTDPNVPQILFTLAGLSGKQGDQDRERRYLESLIAEHPKSSYSNKAVSKQAFDLYARGQHVQAIPALEKFIEIALPDFRQAQARLALADSYKHLDQIPKAYKAYSDLEKLLTPTKNNPYRGGPDEDKVLEVLEKASFFTGYSLQKMKVPESKLVPVRKKAISSYESYIAAYPTATLAPTSMRGIGTIYLELGDTTAAAETFNKIADKYPDSPEGKDSFFLLVDSLIEIERFDEARAAFAKMMKAGASYTPAQYARIGQLMLDRDFFSEAQQAFAGAASGGELDEGVEQRVLYGLGESKYNLGDHAGAAEHLSKLLTKYENTGLFYDAKFLLASAYRGAGEFDKAAEPLNDLFTYAETASMRNKASLELGLLQEASGDANAGLGSFYRVMLLGDASDAESRQYIQQCILEGVRISQDLEEFEKTSEFIERFLADYPDSEKVPELRKLRNKINLRLQTVQ